MFLSSMKLDYARRTLGYREKATKKKKVIEVLRYTIVDSVKSLLNIELMK